MKKESEIKVVENLKELKLSGMVSHLERELKEAKEGGKGYEEFLEELTEIELRIRRENRERRRLREAKFPIMKPLETFDMEVTKELDKRVLKELVSCEYIREKKNVIFLGRSGTGKTHLATGLGIRACQKNYKVKFVTGYGLVNELSEARKEGSVTKVLHKYAKEELLIVDELGYVPFSKEGSELLFQVLAERHERGSVIITSNLGFGEWTELFRDKTMTAALLDRLTHKAYILNCSWESYRLKETLKERKALGEKILNKKENNTE
jgi:DNA replication protein DnaC